MNRRLITVVSLMLALLTAATVGAQQSLRPSAYNVRYGERNQGSRLLDVYLPPDGTPPYPVVLLFHGSPGDKSDLNRDGITPIVVGQGFAAVPVRYTTTLPQAYRDAFCALGWVHANAEEYSLDTGRMALFGVSYGGLTVAGTAAIDEPARYMDDCPHALPDDYALRGVISDAGVFGTTYDFIADRYGEALASEAPDLAPEALAKIVETLRATPSQHWRDLDLPDSVRVFLEKFPIYWVDGQEPPHLLIHGISDSQIPYTESLAYGQALLAARVSVEMVFDRLSGHVPPPRTFDQEMALFLNRVFD